MNHDSLKQTLYSMLMDMYKQLYDEYRNEIKAKSETMKIAKEALEDMKLYGDLYTTLEKIMAKYKSEADPKLKYELYKKLEILNSAIKIMEETKNGFRT